MSILRTNQIQDTGTNVAANISGGTVTFTNPPINVGVSNLQIWRINSSITSTTTPTVLTNWTDAHNTSGFKRIGTAWSVSSGVFTPSTTGVYQITFVADLTNGAETRYIQFDYDYSTNSGSSYTAHTMYCFMPFVGSNNTFAEFSFPRYYNISDASTFRFRVKFSAANTSQTLRGGSDNSISHLAIQRLADAQ